MEREGFKPNAYTYASTLNAPASVGALEWVKEVHCRALEVGLESDLCAGSALVHMYAKSGYIDEARLVFNRMQDRNVVIWNILIGGLAQHGCGHEALKLLRKMSADSVKPDESTLAACGYAGLVDEGRSLFLGMTQEYGIEPDVVHCNCIVDLLGRVARLEEAKLFISKEVLKLEPKNVGVYVLLSNIYAAAGKWEKV